MDGDVIVNFRHCLKKRKKEKREKQSYEFMWEMEVPGEEEEMERIKVQCHLRPHFETGVLIIHSLIHSFIHSFICSERTR